VPEGAELLAELIRDPDLGPVVLLAERDDLSPQDATRVGLRLPDAGNPLLTV
jgi:hypothetical protein